MKPQFSRRRFLTISAATTLAAGLPAWASETTRWTGHAMGAEVSMTLSGVLPRAKARSIFRAVELELDRLERIFSLYQTGSQITQLNRNGVLKTPAPELLEVLSLCGRLHEVSNGAFDPSVQPLWWALAENGGLPGDKLAEARALVGWHHLRFSSDEVRFDRPGCGLTLNGIAQGYVTDRIAALLRALGLDDILIDMGEIAALGKRPWRVGIAAPDGTLVDRVTLQERAIATSAPMGTVLLPSRRMGHILDPRNNVIRVPHELISVSARSAAVADGLSTALCLLPRADFGPVLARFVGARLETII